MRKGAQYIKNYTWALFLSKLSWYQQAKSRSPSSHQFTQKIPLIQQGIPSKTVLPFQNQYWGFTHPTPVFYTKCHILHSFMVYQGTLCLLGFMNIVLLGPNWECNVSTSSSWSLKNANGNIHYQKQNYLFYHTWCPVYMRTSIIKILKPDLPGREGCSVGLYPRSSNQMTLLTYEA